MSIMYSTLNQNTMAERRMFSKKIVKSDWFVALPQSAQNLYFHAGMEADDDGFVSNIRQIMRMLGSSDDDLKLLITKKFLIPFASGLMLIKHWRIHNYIQNDRYTPTTHQEERESIRLKENGVYSLAEGTPLKDVVVSMLYPQVRLGKVSIGKNIKKRSSEEMKTLLVNFERFWLIYPKKVGKKACSNWWSRHHITTEQADEMIKAVEKYKKSDGWQRGFIPNPQTFLHQGRWEDEIEEAPQKQEFKSYSNK